MTILQSILELYGLYVNLHTFRFKTKSKTKEIYIMYKLGG